MNNQFELGSLVRIVGIVRGVHLVSEGVRYYDIELEGKQPFDSSTAFLAEKAIRNADDKDTKFWEDRGKPTEPHKGE